jgi:hypothetical protein
MEVVLRELGFYENKRKTEIIKRWYREYKSVGA